MYLFVFFVTYFLNKNDGKSQVMDERVRSMIKSEIVSKLIFCVVSYLKENENLL